MNQDNVEGAGKEVAGRVGRESKVEGGEGRKENTATLINHLI